MSLERIAQLDKRKWNENYATGVDVCSSSPKQLHQDKAAPGQFSEIEGLLSSLAYANSSVEDSLDRLTVKLGPVLAPSFPTEANGDTSEAPATSLGQAILMERSRTLMQAARIRDLISRLGL